jgi:hypothetical protein
VDSNFTSQAPHGLGRSVIALDVNTGNVLSAVDLTASNIGGTTVGPIGSGIIPFEFILNSHMAQRGYFLDYNGGLWSWGSKAVSSAASTLNFRIDSSEIASNNWSIRKVFQDDNSVASGKNNRYTTPPAPLMIPNFPGPRFNTTSQTPAAAAIAMVSGDRNNPLDRSYTTGNPSPTQHQLTVVFDRQDSRAIGLDTANGPDTGITIGATGNKYLEPLDKTLVTSNTPSGSCDTIWGLLDSTCPNYILGQTGGLKYGYYLTFPPKSGAFVPKGINPPIVVNNSLFYSYFTPTASDPCTGGTGNTTSSVLTNLLKPIANQSSATGLGFISGALGTTWTGVASNYFVVGTTSVLQGGTIPVANPIPGGATTTLAIQSSKTSPTSNYARIRVWRSVQ